MYINSHNFSKLSLSKAEKCLHHKYQPNTALDNQLGQVFIHFILVIRIFFSSSSQSTFINGRDTCLNGNIWSEFLAACFCSFVCSSCHSLLSFSPVNCVLHSNTHKQHTVSVHICIQKEFLSLQRHKFLIIRFISQNVVALCFRTTTTHISFCSHRPTFIRSFI